MEKLNQFIVQVLYSLYRLINLLTTNKGKSEGEDLRVRF